MMHVKSKEEVKYWIVKIDRNGFECAMLVYGIETVMWKYMKNEFGYIPNYHEISYEEAVMARRLGMKGYFC
jgi:hypothetical protein